MATLTAYDLMLSRRSVYEFAALPVSGEVVERCLDAARWAPNLHLTQPWRFVVVQGRSQAAAAAAVSAVDRRTGDALAAAACAVGVLRRDCPDALQRDADMLASGAAVENLILCACDEGLGTVWIGGPAASSPEVRAAVEGAEDEDLVALVAIGYPAAVPPRRPRRALREMVTWLA